MTSALYPCISLCSRMRVRCCTARSFRSCALRAVLASISCPTSSDTSACTQSTCATRASTAAKASSTSTPGGTDINKYNQLVTLTGLPTCLHAAVSRWVQVMRVKYFYVCKTVLIPVRAQVPRTVDSRRCASSVQDVRRPLPRAPIAAQTSLCDAIRHG